MSRPRPAAPRRLMQLHPAVKKFLIALGVNETRLNWWLHERERREESRRLGEKRYVVPSQLRWLSYTHKLCPQCRGIVARDENVCPACGAAVPHMAVYRAMRAVGLVIPEGWGWATALFLAAIVFFYVLSIIIQGPSAIMRPSEVTLYRFGLLSPALVNAGDYWRLFGFGLMHYGLIHIIFNSTAIAQAGPMLENEIGSRRMLVLITVSQLTSALAVMQWHFGAVGASGWLFGLLGFGVTYYHRHGPSRAHARNFFLQWAVYGLVIGYIIQVNNVAHAGGMAGGAALGFIADLTRARKTVWTRVWEWLFWPCAAVWIWTLYHMARSIAGR